MNLYEALGEELGLYARGVKDELTGACRVAIAEAKAEVAEVRRQSSEVKKLLDELLQVRLPRTETWQEGVHYEGSVVSHAGATFQALRDTGREPPHEDWRCIAAAGHDGRSFAIRGTWSETATYRAMDVVVLNGGSFAARKDEPGECPGEGWQLIASQGKIGKPGDRGLPGPKGDRGDAGLPLVAADVDADGLLTLTNGDGSTVTCDLYPLLAKLAK